MFVLKSKYDAMVATYSSLRKKYEALMSLTIEYKIEIDRLHSIKNPQAKVVDAFTQTELQAMIRLCHPDKHNNSDSANQITQKLLSMRVK